MIERVKSIRSRENPQVKALIKLAGSSRERRRASSPQAYQSTGLCAC